MNNYINFIYCAFYLFPTCWNYCKLFLTLLSIRKELLGLFPTCWSITFNVTNCVVFHILYYIEDHGQVDKPKDDGKPLMLRIVWFSIFFTI